MAVIVNRFEVDGKLAMTVRVFGKLIIAIDGPRGFTFTDTDGKAYYPPAREIIKLQKFCEANRK